MGPYLLRVRSRLNNRLNPDGIRNSSNFRSVLSSSVKVSSESDDNQPSILMWPSGLQFSHTSLPAQPSFSPSGLGTFQSIIILFCFNLSVSPRLAIHVSRLHQRLRRTPTVTVVSEGCRQTSYVKDEDSPFDHLSGLRYTSRFASG